MNPRSTVDYSAYCARMAARPSTVPPAPDWSALTAAHGPTWLLEEFQALCADDPDTADEAFETIDGALHAEPGDDDDLALSLRFVIAILRTPGAAGGHRAGLVAVLASLAIGDEGDLPLGGEARGHRCPSYDEVRDVVPELPSLLDDPDERTRAWTASLLGWFPEHATTILPALLAVRQRDASPAARAAATLAYTHCAAETPGAQPLPLTGDLAAPDLLTSGAAALALVRRDGPCVPDAARDHLAALLLEPEPSACDLIAPTFGTPRTAVRALVRTGSLVPRHFDACLTVLRRGHLHQIEPLIGPLLDELFGADRAPVPPYADLDAAQRTLVTVAAVTRAAWSGGELMGAFYAHGLPHTIGELGEYAGLGEPGSTDLIADAKRPGGRRAEINVVECPRAWIEAIDAHLWAVVEEAYDGAHLDTYVDEPSYRAAAETWFAATETRLRQAYGPRDVRIERSPLTLTAWIHPYAGVDVVRFEP